MIHDPAKIIIAVASNAAKPVNEEFLLLDVYTDSKIDVKQIEPEISARTETRAFVLTVGYLLLIGEMNAKHTERYVETERFHYEYAQTGREIE